MKTKSYLLILAGIFCLLPSGLSAQDIDPAEITYVREGDDIVVSYSFSRPETIETVRDLKLFVSLNGGRFFRELHRVTGDVGYVNPSGKKTIRWQIFDEFGYHSISGELIFKITYELQEKAPPPSSPRPPTPRPPTPKPSTPKRAKVYRESERFMWLEYNFMKMAPVGLSLGAVKNWGWYMRFAYSATKKYTVDSSLNQFALSNHPDIVISDQNTLDRHKPFYASFSVGAIRRVTPWFYVAAGAGYGCYQTSSSILGAPDYTILIDQRHGLSVDGFGIFRIHQVSLSVGYTFLPGKNVHDISVGIGVMIPLY